MLKHKYKYLILYSIIQLLVSLAHPSISIALTVGIPEVEVNTLLQGKNVTISGKVIGNYPSAELEITNNVDFSSGPITVDTEGNWTYLFPEEFSTGDYHYTILARTDSQQTPSTTNLDFAVDATGPDIAISSSRFQSQNVMITGNVKDNITQSKNITLQLFNNSNPTDPVEITDVNMTYPTDTSNQWTISLPNQLVEGPYNYLVRATDYLGNTSEKNYKFYVGQLPVVSSIKVNYGDIDSDSGKRITPEINLLESESMNHVARDTKISVTLTDNDISAGTIKNLVALRKKNGVEIQIEPSDPVVNGEEITIEYTLASSLEANTTYYIFINPLLIDLDKNQTNWTTDSSGNPLLPSIKKFTTEREGDISKIPDSKKAFHQMNDPHGDNGLNTNTCGNCHSTHLSNVRGISKQTSSTLGKNLEQPNFEYSTYNYCMACHDGTVAANPESIHQNGHYPQYGTENTSGEKYSAGDCASCHNPHLTWSKENPNILKDRFVHLHNVASKKDTVENYPYGNEPGEEIDSLNQPCEKCHDSDAQKVKDQYIYAHDGSTKGNNEDYPQVGRIYNSLVESQSCQSCHTNVAKLVKLVKGHDSKLENKDNPIAVNYKLINYRNSTATGIPDDYGICLRCHDGNKEWTDADNIKHPISNISKYFDETLDTLKNDNTNSTLSRHRISSNVGTKLIKTNANTTSNDGHIPCAECHDNHGSSNILLLKDKLGHEDRQSFSATSNDKNEDGILTVSKERTFCIKCHNGSTAIYGIVGRELDVTVSDGHKVSTRACSECHGVGDTPQEKALSAAHSPQQGFNPPE